MAHGKYRKLAVRPQSTPNSDINVTPLVDVVLVLLIIFMVVTPLMEKDIEVRVPSTEQVENVAEVPADQLVVSLSAEGELSINAEKIPEDEYVEKLRRIFAAKASGERLVFFTADDTTNYAKLVTALDGAKKAGADILGMMTEKAPAPPAPEAPSPDAPVAPEAPPAPGTP